MLDKKGYVENLKRIDVAHLFYIDADEGDKERIYDACEVLFDKVESRYDSSIPGSTPISPTVGGSIHDSGLDRSFGVLLLLFGDIFLAQQFGEDCGDIDKFIEKYII
jgi:hypothetical protein